MPVIRREEMRACMYAHRLFFLFLFFSFVVDQVGDEAHVSASAAAAGVVPTDARTSRRPPVGFVVSLNFASRSGDAFFLDERGRAEPIEKEKREPLQGVGRRH